MYVGRQHHLQPRQVYAQDVIPLAVATRIGGSKPACGDRFRMQVHFLFGKGRMRVLDVSPNATKPWCKQFHSGTPQIFYYDDFLGETFLGERLEFLGKKEDSAILDFMEIIARSKHGKLILTTREHILQHAFSLSERFRQQRGGLADHRCILDLDDYSLLDRARILYNHIYFSDLPDTYKAALLKNHFYMRILKHPNYNPRLVEWLARFTNVKRVPVARYQQEVQRILDNPEELWRGAFERQISEAARSILLALYSLGGEAHLDHLEDAWKHLHEHRATKYNRQRAAEDWHSSLQELEGGFLVFKNRIAKFVNPSLKDFLDAVLWPAPTHPRYAARASLPRLQSDPGESCRSVLVSESRVLVPRKSLS